MKQRGAKYNIFQLPIITYRQQVDKSEFLQQLQFWRPINFYNLRQQFEQNYFHPYYILQGIMCR